MGEEWERNSEVDTFLIQKKADKEFLLLSKLTVKLYELVELLVYLTEVTGVEVIGAGKYVDLHLHAIHLSQKSWLGKRI